MAAVRVTPLGCSVYELYTGGICAQVLGGVVFCATRPVLLTLRVPDLTFWGGEMGGSPLILVVIP